MASPVFERGRQLYEARVGRMNMACRPCHDAKWGKTLPSEKISRSQPTAWPAYR